MKKKVFEVAKKRCQKRNKFFKGFPFRHSGLDNNHTDYHTEK